MDKAKRFARRGVRSGLLSVAVLLLATACATSDEENSSSPSSSSTPPAGRADAPSKDNPNLLRGFRSWLKTNKSSKDDELAEHALSVSLDYSDGRSGVAKVLTNYGPWGRAESQVGPLAEAFTAWWDKDPAASSAQFLSQGGKTVKETALYAGDKPENLLTEFRSWVTQNTSDGRRLAPHITALTLGYGVKGSGAATVSTNYLTYKAPQTQNCLESISEAFAAWWEKEKGVSNVTVTSEDQGSQAEKELTPAS
ncbi:hypothetical protein [Streptomyces spectabilis]|uniref:Lipoprotein n=1 Tax=Streptomyces spectabilis TaxID=68270 RepID=A0A7W8ESV6_STRST|nr:hypothetical protein [Streptomyces spectabilis]MBB5104157.1 hypothetical protein [Streptomyces spectabilis]MCI3905481.1 hypothetical protein [Streptomyces spectabilis]GGU98272.1 hypothetical protein GCM10010245_00140 [Streptomyces spectabilis]